MSFDLRHFDDFTNALKINSKERGEITLGASWLGTQRMFLQQVKAGLDDDIHEFVTLKCRQIGISTACLALDLYWPSQNPGMFGAIVVHDDPARDSFRAQIEMYYGGLPEEWQIDIAQHNRNQLVFGHGSMLQYKVSGLKEKSAKSLGRSSGLAYLHATEVAFWGDPSQISSLKASLAEENPARFYNWESTANGFNHFHEMWEEAKKAVSQKAIFISWWANDFYRKRIGSKEYEIYWEQRKRLSREERDMIKQVKSLYGVDIDSEQIAWYRWMRAEKVTDEMDLLQEYPPTEEDAFVATGSKFFTGKNLSEAMKRIKAQPKPQTFRIEIGSEFTDTKLVDCKPDKATLRVWAEPIQKAFYVIGADPAYGSSEKSNNYCIEVYRAYANRVEQVAEYAQVDTTTYAFAWVLIYLAGCYTPCIFNLEMNGPGEAVLRETQNLKKLANNALTRERANTMRDVVAHIKQYYYRRMDTVGGMPSALHTLTNERTKDVMMNLIRDYFERGILVPHSQLLVGEMKTVVRAEGAAPAAQAGCTDDTVLGSGLALMAWNDQLRTRLILQNEVWTPPVTAIEVVREGHPTVSRAVRNYLHQIGVTRGLVQQQTGSRISIPKRRRS